MKLSIVIPTKNEESLLPNLLESIRRQTFTDFEMIVADAGSTDRTREIASTYGATIVDGGLPGPGRNKGAAVAQGEVVVFFDADVVLPHRDFLKDCLQEMQGRKLDVATCRVHAQDGRLIDHMLHGAYNMYTLATERFLPHAPGFCLFATRAIHERMKGFDEEVVFAEDHDYVQRAKKQGGRFGILRGHKIPVSIRRLAKEGRLKLALKYMYTEARMIVRGPFKNKMPFHYEFANFQKKKEKKGE